MSFNSINISKKLVPQNYMDLARQAQKSRERAIRELLEKRSWPKNGWSDEQIVELINSLSALDSNNFTHKNGLGEREGRIKCKLVSQRHYSFAHGIGRSGDLMEAQPKAVGSTILNNLTNELLLHLFQTMGLHSCKKCFLVPMATGMTLTLCLLALKSQRPNANYVIWPRIDQKACFKSITTAGLIPIPIEPVIDEHTGALSTNVEELFKEMSSKPEQILCLMSTVSCFAPRNADDVLKSGEVAKSFGIPHLVNNAYGLQSLSIVKRLQKAACKDLITLLVQSTDKNLMVPVGGAIVAGFNNETVQNVAKRYPGRASSSQSLDVLITLLSLGQRGYLECVHERSECFDYLRQQLEEFSLEEHVTVIPCKTNPISLAITLDNIPIDLTSQLGSMLFSRGVFGARVISVGEEKTIDGYTFKNWGSHSSKTTKSYLTVAAGLGVTKTEISTFMQKLRECWQKLKYKEMSNI